MTTQKKILLPVMAMAMIALVGCSGDGSPSPLAPAPVIVDTSPPAIPTGLAAASSSRVIKLAWDLNTVDADFEGFLVYRLAFENAYLLTPVPINETTFVDQQPLNIPCGYAVSSIDESGNESAWLEVMYNGCPEIPDYRIEL